MTNENLYSDDKQRQAEELKNQARADAHELAEQAKQSADEIRAKAETEARAKAEMGRDQAVGQMESLAHAARVAADDLRNSQHDALSQYVGSVASSVGQLADSLRHKSVDELIRDVEGIARRNPGLFIAGSVAIGLGIARFAKASSDRLASSSSYADVESYGAEGQPRYSGGYAGAFSSDADYAGARGFTDDVERQPTRQPGYDSQFDYEEEFNASADDDSFDDSFSSETTTLAGSDADNPALLVERDLGGEEAPSEAFRIKDRDDKSPDKSTNI